MMSASKLKVVSSGRLTGTTRRGKKDAMVQKFTRPLTGPAYSLYSTDSEDQVSTIHRGLDRCASLLDCLLQADSADTCAPPPPIHESKPRQNGVVDTRGQGLLGRRCNLEKRKTGRTKTAVLSPAVIHPSDAPGADTDTPRSVGPAEGANQVSRQPTNRTTARFNARLPSSTPSRNTTVVPNGDPQSGAPSLGRPPPPGGPSACLTAGANGGTLASSPPLPRALVLSPPLPGALALSPPLPGALALSHPLPLHPPYQPPQTHPDPAPSASPLALPLSLVAPSPVPRPPVLVRQPVVPSLSDPPGRPLPLQTPPPTSGPIGGRGGAVNGQATEDEGEREECTAGEYTAGECTAGERTPGAWTAKECTVERVQHALEELWTALAGKGYTAAERLLSEFERAFAEGPQGTQGPLKTPGPQGTQTSRALQALRSQNSQLHRCMRILNQQLQERERAERHCRESHCDATRLEAELSAIQADVSELRMALREKEAENPRIRAGSVALCPGMSGQALLLAQQRLKEMECRPGLCSVLQGPPLTRRALDQHQLGHDLSGPSSNQVHQYLSSLGADQSGAGILEPLPSPVWEDDHCISLSVVGGASESVGGGASESVGGGASESVGGGVSESVRGGAWLDLGRLTFAPSEEVVNSSLGGGGQSYQNVLRLLRRSSELAPLPGLGQSLGPPDWEVMSHWSVGSGSTFDTRDEVAFCHGLAVLDASIASLQRSLRKDLVI